MHGVFVAKYFFPVWAGFCKCLGGQGGSGSGGDGSGRSSGDDSGSKKSSDDGGLVGAIANLIVLAVVATIVAAALCMQLLAMTAVVALQAILSATVGVFFLLTVIIPVTIICLTVAIARIFMFPVTFCSSRAHRNFRGNFNVPTGVRHWDKILCTSEFLDARAAIHARNTASVQPLEVVVNIAWDANT